MIRAFGAAVRRPRLYVLIPFCRGRRPRRPIPAAADDAAARSAAILNLLSRFPAAGYIPSLFSSHEYGIVMLNIRALLQHNA